MLHVLETRENSFRGKLSRFCPVKYLRVYSYVKQHKNSFRYYWNHFNMIHCLLPFRTLTTAGAR
jgi:hypothetical protein